MNLTDEELQRERGEHQLVADAMASVRLFHTLFGDGEQTREWVRELVRVMYRTGCRDQAWRAGIPARHHGRCHRPDLPRTLRPGTGMAGGGSLTERAIPRVPP